MKRLPVLISLCILSSGWRTILTATELDSEFLPHLLYTACMASDMRDLPRGGNPQLAKHLICDVGRGVCGKEPESQGCKNALREYRILERAADPSFVLFTAASIGNTEVLRTMIAKGGDANASIPGLGGWTPLAIAAAEGRGPAVSALLEAGGDPNRKNDLGRTALMFAASYGYTEIVEMLARAAADLDAKPTDKDGMPALIAAASRGHAATVAALLRLGARADAVVDATGFTGLMHASGVGGGLGVMRALLDGGADINAGVPVGTPLAIASQAGRADAVKLLLERGADVNRPFRFNRLEGITPLMIAASEGHVDVVQLLIAHGADLNARNSLGSSALVLAKMAGHEIIVDVLRKAGR